MQAALQQPPLRSSPTTVQAVPQSEWPDEQESGSWATLESGQAAGAEFDVPAMNAPRVLEQKPNGPAGLDPSSLAALELPETDLPPGIPTVNFTQIAPLLPMVAGLNATVLASWIPVVERTPPESLALLVPAFNAIEASTIEALVAGLPYLNMDTLVIVMPLVNALSPSTLAAWIKLLGDVSGAQQSNLVPTS